MTPLPDRQILQLLAELKAAAPGFLWESAIWAAAAGRRRSPYRALLLFGLSPRTRDARLSDMCRRFFRLFPDAPALARRREDAADAARGIVRPRQLPFITSAADALTGGVPRTGDALRQINGVGDKIAEGVLAYGWGDDALPIDAHVVRVLSRVFGITPAPGTAQNAAPARLRRELKCVYHRCSGQFADAGIAMVDIHEILRLHGQLCCVRQPACRRCPVSLCQSRREPQSEPAAAPSLTIWNDWRELLYEPAGI